MLLNFTNHHSSSWSENQRGKAIKKYGSINDLGFPQIDPSWSEEEVVVLVEQYETKILEMNPQAVHVMGEMTFCFKLISNLKKQGIPCVASTTKRVVESEQGGTKTSVFQFVNFRSY